MTELDPSVLLGSQYYVNTEDTPEQIRAGIHAMGQAGLKLVTHQVVPAGSTRVKLKAARQLAGVGILILSNR